MEELEKAYEMMTDERSKEMFLMVLVYKLFGESPGLRFPMFYSKIFDSIPKIEKLKIDDEEIELWLGKIKVK